MGRKVTETMRGGREWFRAVQHSGGSCEPPEMRNGRGAIRAVQLVQAAAGLDQLLAGASSRVAIRWESWFSRRATMTIRR